MTNKWADSQSGALIKQVKCRWMVCDSKTDHFIWCSEKNLTNKQQNDGIPYNKRNMTQGQLFCSSWYRHGSKHIIQLSKWETYGCKISITTICSAVHLAPWNSSNIFGYGNQEWWKAIGIVRQDLWRRKKSQEWGCFIDNNDCWLPPRKTLWNKHLCLRYSQEIRTHSSFVSANTGPNWRPRKGAAYGSV